MKVNNKKVYVVGSQTGYASWIANRILVDKIEEADLVLFTGGEDIDPCRYNESCGKMTHFNEMRDKYEIDQWHEAVQLNKPILGICRGAQLACVMSGGKLVQHMTHPYNHKIKFYDDSEVTINSLHHQLQYPFSIPISDYNVIAYAEQLSTIYLNGNNENKIMKSGANNIVIEPEVVYYKKTKSLGIQCHPEMLSQSSAAVKIFNLLVDLLIQDKLIVITTLNTQLANAHAYVYDEQLEEEPELNIMGLVVKSEDNNGVIVE